MKVWVVGRGYPTEKNQMLGSFELEQAKMLARGGMEVAYLLVDMRSIRRWRKFGVDCRQEDGVTIATLNLPIGRLLNKEQRNRLFPKAMVLLEKKLIRRYGLPAVIHVHYPALFPYAIVEELQKRGVKVVSTEHWTKVQNKTINDEALQNLKNYVQKGDAICCVGAPLRQSIIDLTKTKRNIEIVQNVVIPLFQSDNSSGNHHGKFRFLASGRLVPVKQFDLIASAFLKVFQKKEDVILTIAGDGEEAEKIKKIIANYHAEKQIEMPGHVSRLKMAKLIAECDVLVVFSETETFCVPIIEAWACGKPVIATETTVFANHSDNRLGIMADSQNVETLENALKNIYEHYGDYDPKWISAYANQHFSEAVVRQKLTDIYQSI